MNPYKFSELCIKKKLQFNNKNLKLFVGKNMIKAKRLIDHIIALEPAW